MPKLEFTPLELKAYFTDKKMYHYCMLARDKEMQMRVHADGVFPDKLINERRPNESLEVLTYRKQIFVPVTQPYFDKIENTLQKIRRSSDWSIKYPDASFDKIVEGEKMIDYVEHNYPVFESVTNWAFSLLLRNYLIDANALLMVAPLYIPEAENEFVKPVVTIFNSCDVIDFVDGDYAVMINKVGSSLWKSAGVPGKSFYIVTTEWVWKYEQSGPKTTDYTVTYEYAHGLEMLPVFKLGGITVDVYGTHSLYKSRVSGIIPMFTEALREYSDLQASIVLHLFLRRWEYSQNECTACKGTGQRMGYTEGIGACQVTCETCHGAGYIATGPYSKTLIKPAAADQLQLPTPPMGVEQIPHEIIELQQKSIKEHIYSALAAINFEFLADTPLNQSGTAKEVDKDELNSMVHSIAEDIVRIMDKVYWFIGLYRYSAQYTPDQIYDMLPAIAVPEKFDILSTKYYDEQMTSAIKNKLNPAILNAMEVAYASKAFNNDAHIAKYVQLILQLDPLAGISEDDKMSRLSNGGITQLDYVVSSNINKFVAELVEASNKFVDLDVTKQKLAVYKLAEAQISAQVTNIIPVEEVPVDA